MATISLPGYESDFPTGFTEFRISEGGEIQNKANPFYSNEKIRNIFIRRVFFIVTFQLIVTLGNLALFTFSTDIKEWVNRHPNLVWVSLCVVILSMILMAFYEDLRREAPTSIILLCMFTIAESFLFGVVTVKYDNKIIFIAVGIMIIICLTWTIFAIQTIYDFSVAAGLLMATIIITAVNSMTPILYPDSVMTIIYSSIVAFVFAFYLTYDIMLIVSGDHKYEINPDEHVFTALTLYVDIVNLIAYILKMYCT